MAGIYDRYILPRLLRCGCGTKPIRKQREKVVPKAEGVILEVGMGSGENLPFYDVDRVEKIYGLEPSAGMRALAQPAVQQHGLPVEFIDLPGEQIPLPDASVDTCLLTYTLCTIPDRPAALAQINRVLKPDGRLIFCEHGLAPDEATARWQRRINPVWSFMFGGCHIQQPIPRLIAEAGFQVDDLNEMYLPGTPKFCGYNYWGSACKSAG